MSPTGGGWDTGNAPLEIYVCECHHEPHAGRHVWDDMLNELSESPLPGARYAYEVVKRRRASEPPWSLGPVAVSPDATLRDWQRDLLTFDADGLSFDQVVANLLGVKSVNLRTEQDNEGNPTSEDRRWRVQYFGGTYGGTLDQCLPDATE